MSGLAQRRSEEFQNEEIRGDRGRTGSELTISQTALCRLVGQARGQVPG